MRIRDLITLIFNWGWRIRPDQEEAFESYLISMLEKNRVMFVTYEGSLEAVIFYFLTDDYKSLYKKDTWEVVKDNPFGSQIYIDKMISRNTTLSLRRRIQDAIEETFPNVMEGYYHRSPKDRCVKIYKRGTKHELQSTVS